MSKTESNVKVTEFEVQLNGLPTKSAKIRFLHQAGLTKSQIAKKLDIRYQFVRNVLIVPLKKAN
jgi:hypothetical protein